MFVKLSVKNCSGALPAVIKVNDWAERRIHGATALPKQPRNSVMPRPDLRMPSPTLRSNSATAARLCICNRQQDCFRCYRSPVKSRAAPCCAFQIPRSIEPRVDQAYPRQLHRCGLCEHCISSSRPVLLKTRGTQNLCSAHRPTPSTSIHSIIFPRS
jgi:hypothetical protein